MSEPIQLALLYSAPLIYYDNNHQAQPIDGLNFEAEQESLFDAFNEAGKSINIRIETATSANLRVLTTLGCRMLHYSGHGSPDFLAFEDGKGSMHPIDADTLTKLFAAGGTKGVQLVFVSACHSLIAGESFVKAGVPHVVAVRLETPVYDDAARTFAQQFYLALLAGKTVKQAFDVGCESVGSMPQMPEKEKKKFLLLPESGNHNMVILDDVPEGDWCNLTKQLPPNNLPAVPEEFLGRNIDLQKVIASVLDGRLTTIRGAPGIGKTALAIAVGNYINERHIFRDGIFLMGLRGVRSIEEMRSIIARALGVIAKNDDDLFAALRQRHCLLILDNLEDPLNFIPGESRKFISHLLQQSRYTKVLITSRQAIGGGISGNAEKVHHLLHLDPINASRLFLKLSPRDLSLAEIGTDDPDMVLKMLSKHPVLKFLYGHPHAIALATPLLQDKSLDQLRVLLEEKKEKALEVSGIGEDDREATTSFSASIGVSVDYMREKTPEALRLFSLMGLLPGGALVQDLSAIWGSEWQMLMDALVRASLVEQEKFIDEDYFYTFPFVTTYAERLLTPEDRNSFAIQICEHYRETIRSLSKAVGTSRFSSAILSFELEEKNFWACLDYQDLIWPIKSDRAESPQADIGIYLSSLLLFAPRLNDGVKAANIALSIYERIGDLLGKANTLLSLGDLKVRMDDLDDARKDYDVALPIYRDIGLRLGEATILRSLGDLKVRMDDLDGARKDYDVALPIYRDIGERLGEANTLGSLGDLKVRMDDLDGARKDYDVALPIYRDNESRLGEATILRSLGDLKVRMNDLDGAMKDYDVALPIYRDIGERFGEANTLGSLGDLKVRMDDLDGARKDYDVALPIYRDIGSRLGEANTFGSLGDLKVRMDDLDGAGKDYDVALPIYRDIGERLGEATTLRSLGDLKVRMDDLDGARKDYDVALPIYRDIGSRLGEANTLRSLGDLKVRMDDLDGAMKDYDAALPIYRDIGSRLGEANTLLSLGDLKVRMDDLDGARKDYDVALSIYRQIWERVGEAKTLKSLGDLKARKDDLEGAK